jgi:nucleoside-triphosphatase THEP1
MLKVDIVTGPIQSGKTSTLLKLLSNQGNVNGILTPVVDGKRAFVNIATGEQFNMEAEKDEKDVLKVGKYIFSQPAFKKAIQVLSDGAIKGGWLVIDEIGPLELIGGGFHDILREILSKHKTDLKLLLVVREALISDVVKFFGLNVNLVYSLPTVPRM